MQKRPPEYTISIGFYFRMSARAPVQGGRLSRNARRESTTDPSQQSLHLQLCGREFVKISNISSKLDTPHTCVEENEGGKDRSCRDERRWCGGVR